MARPYSEDLRCRVVAMVLAGGTVRSVGDRFDIAPSTVVRWMSLYRSQGDTRPGKFGGHRPRVLEPHRDFVVAQFSSSPHMTIDGLHSLLKDRGAEVCRDTVWRFVRHLGLSFKKKPVGKRATPS